MPTLIKPKQPEVDFWEIVEHEKQAIRVRVSGSFSISDAKELSEYIDKLKTAHAHLKSQKKAKRK